jgi:arylsulfatase A-like enzyme
MSVSCSRRTFLKQAAVGLAAASGASAATSRKPNIVFFLVDDMGWMDCTTYGSRYYETPNVERLAKRSMRFTNAYAAAPLCSATRASILTGKYPARTHITGASGHVPAHPGPLIPDEAPPWREMLLPRCKGYLPLEEYTLAEALKDAGYRTGFVGKWHLGHDEKYWPEAHGFDSNAGGGRWPGPPSYFSPYHISKLPDGPEGEYIADRLTDEALAFIGDAKDQPFFLNFWQYAVHAPYQGKEEYRAYFEKKKDPRSAQHNAVMGAMLKSMDDSLGRLLDRLEDLDLMDDTIIVFTSDNGGNMYDRTARDGVNLGAGSPEGRTPTNNAPLRSGKASVYEGGIRVPAMIYWPGVATEEAVCDDLINTIDYYPTLLDMAGITPAAEQVFDGISITPALRGKSLKRDTLFGHFPHNISAVPCRPASWVRQGDWKLIRFYEHDENFPDRIELYDLKHDIGEIQNVAKEHPKKAAQLEALLDAHLAETGALVPKKNPNYRPDAPRELAGWKPQGQCWIQEGEKSLVVHSTGGDPHIAQNNVPAVAGKLRFRLRMESQSDGAAQFFWTTEKMPRFGPRQRLDFVVNHDGQIHDYEVPFVAGSPLQAIRIDPAAAPGLLQIHRIQLIDETDQVIAEWEF